MTPTIELQPATRPINGSIRPPGSKSITNRALVCAALANGTSKLNGVLDSDDTRVMIESLGRLGIEIEQGESKETLFVDGTAGQLADNADLFVGNSGTTIRFLTALVAIGHGHYLLDGVPRMRERPIEDLLIALRQFGVDAQSRNDNRCPPVVVRTNGIQGGSATVAGSISSQYLSGLMMALPMAVGPTIIEVSGDLVSKPYVKMTAAVMQSFGVETALNDDLSQFRFRGGEEYIASGYEIEPDASAASYFWAAAAVTGGRVRVEGLSRNSLQGDIRFVECLKQMGCEIEYADDSIEVSGPLRLNGIDIDMNDISDTSQTLSVVALFADGPTTIRGIGHNRHKETDRIGNLAVELRKLGATVDEFDDGFRVKPGPASPAEIETYDDHRMAMSFALAGLRIPGIRIKNPDCTAKTYPNFWDDLSQLVKGSKCGS